MGNKKDGMVIPLYDEWIERREIFARHTIVRIVKDAHKKGISAQVKAGKIQFVTVAYDAKGKSTVTPITKYMTPEEADKFVEKA